MLFIDRVTGRSKAYEEGCTMCLVRKCSNYPIDTSYEGIDYKFLVEGQKFSTENPLLEKFISNFCIKGYSETFLKSDGNDIDFKKITEFKLSADYSSEDNQTNLSLSYNKDYASVWLGTVEGHIIGDVNKLEEIVDEYFSK